MPLSTNHDTTGSAVEYTHALDEFHQLHAEWLETRSAIARFDQIIIDLRKYGFSLITFLITASNIASTISPSLTPFSVIIGPFAIMILVCGLFLADRYHEVLLLACILRSRQLEDASDELLSTSLENTVFNRLNLTTFLEDKVQKARARKFSLTLYILFLVGSFSLGFVSLLNVIHYNDLSFIQGGLIPTVILILLLGMSYVFLRMIDRNMKEMMSDLQNDIMIDNRIIIRVLFPSNDVSAAIQKLAMQIETAYDNQKFLMVTVGRGGLHFAHLLLQELRRHKVKTFEAITVFTERVKKENGESAIRIIDPPSDYELEDREVLIVDDLVSSGRTLEHLTKQFHKAGARVRSCILINAQNRHKVRVHIDFCGLTVTARDKDSYVGCGLDIYGECRELPYIGVVRSYKSKTPR
ncbi:MAG: phosphoribosyltransferase family protein [Anaerolineales bacterium]